MVCYRADKYGVHTYTDTANDNTRRPKLVSGTNVRHLKGSFSNAYAWKNLVITTPEKYVPENQNDKESVLVVTTAIVWTNDDPNFDAYKPDLGHP